LKGHPALKKLEEKGFELIYGRAGQQPTEAEQMKVLPDCIAYLAGIEPITSRVLQSAKKLKVISRNGVGIENIDLKTAKELGIAVKIASDANSQGVAELTIALLLAAARTIPLCSNYMKKNVWQREEGNEVINKTLGVIGCGNIGKKVIRMALALNMKILGYDISPDVNFNPSNDFKFVPLEELFKKSDFISLHCPPCDNPIIDTKQIEIMKKGVIVINTARATVVDKKSIIHALNIKQIKLYATDVYETEPPAFDELINNKSTITTPHIGGYTKESIDRAVQVAVDNILKVVK
jgi:D-3-phosphoglycerate dehydrogenase